MKTLLDIIIARQEAFWAKTERVINGCLLWTGALNDKGYGVIGVPYNGRNITMIASRYSFMLRHKIILKRNELALHTCDTPACVECDHLFKGTHKNNYDDMVSKGRRNKRKGQFSENEIFDIRDMIEAGYKKKDIAAKYLVDPSLITLIDKRKRYGHI